MHWQTLSDDSQSTWEGKSLETSECRIYHELLLTYQIVAEDDKALSSILVIRIRSATDGELMIIVETEWGRQVISEAESLPKGRLSVTETEKLETTL